MTELTRRLFLRRSALLAAATAAGVPATAPARQPAARGGMAADRLRVAVVGLRSRGRQHIEGFAGRHNCEVTVLCDCDEACFHAAMADKKVQNALEQQAAKPRFEKDFRKLLDDPTVDLLAIATPNHWHALMAVWGMRAGKDVYLEKPATHNVHEGRLLVEAVRKYNRICQVGTQSRSMQGMREAMAYLHAGQLGTIELAYATCYKNRESIGRAGRDRGEQTPPASMDYDLWTGPARLEPPRRNGKFGPVHYDWHWFWNYGNGDLGNQGVHEVDKARWGLQVGLPTSVVSLGGRFGYEDDAETPNTQLCLYQFPTAPLIFEVRGLNVDKNKERYRSVACGNLFFGTKGVMVIDSYSSGVVLNPEGVKVAEFKGGGDHFGTFVQAVRSRRAADLTCNVEEGHASAAVCHLANISYRLGEARPLDQPVPGFQDTPAAVEALRGLRDHLTRNGLDLAQTIGRVGQRLAFDPRTERFAESPANELLFREYRKGFDITEAV